MNIASQGQLNHLKSSDVKSSLSSLESKDIVFSTDNNFQFRNLLPYAQQFFHTSADDAEGKSLFTLLPPLVPEDVKSEIKSVVSTEVYWRGILPFQIGHQQVWKDTFVRPIFRKDKVVGTQWMLSHAEPELVESAKRVYGSRITSQTGLQWGFLALAIVLVGATLFTLPSYVYPVIAFGAIVMGMFASPYFLKNSAQKDNELDASLYPYQRKVFAKSRATELLDYEVALKQGALYAAMSRVDAGTKELSEAFEVTKANAENLASAAEETSATTEQISAASSQMTQAINEISQSAEATAEECKDVREKVKNSSTMIEEASDSVSELAKYIGRSAEATTALVEKSESAKQFSERIDNIAEQTNLLALNAAIEAARAGDSGRGFSVVADEVRALSQSTQEAVDEIEETINSIADSIKAWQSDMNEQLGLAERCEKYSERSKSEMLSIRTLVSNITEQMEQVAAASTENQQALAEVNDAIQQTKEATRSISESAAETHESVSGVGGRLREFRSISAAMEED